MIQPPRTGAELEALQRIVAKPEGRILFEYLQNQMNTAQEQIISLQDPTQVRWAQGEMRVLKVLLQALKP